ncbi:hypothetical protein [Pontibacter vulgaris]|uniref:hypothetical protein n=1 Tax=Pontibacter vulgaris TaxID=2905679 RepID=UPI001FA7AA70|nr:hypothetical protein [Pontibacter vulgaris]
MGLKDIVNKVMHEVKAAQGEETKDKLYTNEQEYPDETSAAVAFEQSRKKLFDVNSWTNLKGINSTFTLYDSRGRQSAAISPQIANYIKIILPGAAVENWVQVAGIRSEKDLAEFTVHPSQKPAELTDEQEVVKHFFVKEASSTFRVERQGTRLIASEIGKNEAINNQGEEAGNRALLNTLIAEGGWAGVQALQWNKLTAYLVHLEEAKES